MRRHDRLGILIASAALACSAGSALAQAAASACDPAPARATSVQGSVEARRAGEAQWRLVSLNDTFCPGDTLRVQDRSRADLQLLNQSVLRLNANSSITVETPKERSTGVVDLVRGAVHFFSRGPNSLEVKTPYTVAGVRGTEFFIRLEPQRALLTVFEGTVVADNPAGSLTLRDGESALAEAGKPPVPRVVVRPRDAVHWALHYPPVIHSPGAAGHRAQTLLAVGAVDEARSDVARALQLRPNDADALSLQSIMAVVQGEKDEGLRLAIKLRPAVVLVELAMPVRDGWSVCRQLKANPDTFLIPIVATSLDRLPSGSYHRARSAGFVDSIARPVERLGKGFARMARAGG